MVRNNYEPLMALIRESSKEQLCWLATTTEDLSTFFYYDKRRTQHAGLNPSEFRDVVDLIKLKSGITSDVERVVGCLLMISKGCLKLAGLKKWQDLSGGV